MSLQVKRVEGEPTRFLVEGHALRCAKCGRRFERVQSECAEFTARQRSLLRRVGALAKVEKHLRARAEKAGLYDGAKCPRCGDGRLEPHWHLVDIAAYGFNGQCSCEHFAFGLEPELRKLGRAEQGMGRWRCGHVDAARDFALDVSLRWHEHVRLQRARGRREEDAP